MADQFSPGDLVRRSFLRESDFFRISSPLFSAMTRASADDDDIVDLCLATRPGQSPGNLLMCVVQFLVMKSPGSRLAGFYPSMTATPRPLKDAFPAFREFCLDHYDEVSELLSWRTVNTNLVEKTCSLLPSIQYVNRLSDEPLSLLEICCSSGLNMLFDEYHYDFGPAGQVGPEASPIRLSCRLVGDGRPPIDAMPFVAKRVGVDLVTIDVSDPTERLWMEAVLGPEWEVERQRLRIALALRQKRDLRILKGDALAAIPSLLSELPGQVCILQSYCIGHWSEAARNELESVLKAESRHRDIHRLSVEMPDTEPPETARRRLARLAAAKIPILQKSSPSRIDHLWYSNGEMKTRLLGEGSIFGSWLDWNVPNA